MRPVPFQTILTYMEECIFCQIAAGKSPASVMMENDDVIAFKSISPASETHILVVPKKHIAHFDDISKEDKDVMFEMVKAIQKLVEDMDLGEGYKLVFNAGKYQAVPHLHWHLLAGDLETIREVINQT